MSREAMYAIKRQQHVDAEWLVTLRPEGWGERDQARGERSAVSPAAHCFNAPTGGGTAIVQH
jgi:hypothetical protein